MEAKRYNFPHWFEWHLDSKVGPLHREDGPAIEYDDGVTKVWYINGSRHRIDGPAYIDNEFEIWYSNGLKHRIDGPAVKSKYDSSERWDINGKLHREDGPAITDGNAYTWYKNGLIHREDGPAVINNNNDITQYFLNDVILTKEQWVSQVRENRLFNILQKND